MPSNSNAVCIPCRTVSRRGSQCQKCGERLIFLNYRWRAPKKDDDKAWARIAEGDWFWEIDPKEAQWDARDYEVNKQNPKQSQTKLFPTLADARKNWRLRWNMRPHL